MKFTFLIVCLIFNTCIITPCFADERLVSDPVENVEGDTIVILDEQTADANIAPSQSWQGKAQEILINAMSLTGIKYKYGGTSPETGFDCSGFVRYVFSQAANLTLPPTARAISQIGKTVQKDELQPGDLVFFNTLKSAFSHVGIYVGDNKFIHSPRAGGAVRIENMQTGYWAKRFNGAQRVEQENLREN
jgi:cell wall-associated NlpC family hydrolase